MMLVPGHPNPPAGRILEGLQDREDVETLVLSTGSAGSSEALDQLLASWAGKPAARVLILGTVGTHRDARAARLRALWELEEKARATGLPVLALRLAPIVGPGTPLWLRLRSGEAFSRAAQALLQPVAEADVRKALGTALAAEADWAGWYDVVGPEALTLEELAALARREGSLPRGAGAWEPSLEELREQRLCDARPWIERFRITPRRVTQEALAWS